MFCLDVTQVACASTVFEMTMVSSGTNLFRLNGAGVLGLSPTAGDLSANAQLMSMFSKNRALVSNQFALYYNQAGSTGHVRFGGSS